MDGLLNGSSGNRFVFMCVYFLFESHTTYLKSCNMTTKDAKGPEMTTNRKKDDHKHLKIDRQSQNFSSGGFIGGVGPC